MVDNLNCFGLIINKNSKTLLKIGTSLKNLSIYQFFVFFESQFETYFYYILHLTFKKVFTNNKTSVPHSIENILIFYLNKGKWRKEWTSILDCMIIWNACKWMSICRASLPQTGMWQVFLKLYLNEDVRVSSSMTWWCQDKPRVVFKRKTKRLFNQ